MKTADGHNFNECKTLWFIDDLESRLLTFERREMIVKRDRITLANGEDFSGWVKVAASDDFYAELSSAQTAFKRHLEIQIAWETEKIKSAQGVLQIMLAKLDRLAQETSVPVYPATKKLETVGGVRV